MIPFKMRYLIFLSITLLYFSCRDLTIDQSSSWTVDSTYVDHVWSGHSVLFDLVTRPPYQYVAYYDSSRSMVVAQRKLDEAEWHKVTLPEVTGWDSHNYIAMAVDKSGTIHVSGNMHGDTLVYFMSDKPHDITSLLPRDSLIGTDEHEVTYPKFMETADGDLIFQYRIGMSGKGNQIFNRYDPDAKRWSRLIDQPLVDGQGEMNAYLHGPVPGPDGYYHLVWVWRNTPDAATNHDLSYAKSKNLVNWYKSNGDEQPLPITYENAEIVDPVPVHGGMINGNTKIGFDQQNRPVITYHKFDEQGYTQLYNARWEGEEWKIYQSTKWNFRWEFGGYGSLNSRVGVYPINVEGSQLTQRYFIDSVGIQKVLLDPMSLTVQSIIPDERPVEYQTLESKMSGDEAMVVHLVNDEVNQDEMYVLRWETLPPHNDLPLESDIPQAQPLVLYHLAKAVNQ